MIRTAEKRIVRTQSKEKKKNDINTLDLYNINNAHTQKIKDRACLQNHFLVYILYYSDQIAPYRITMNDDRKKQVKSTTLRVVKVDLDRHHLVALVMNHVDRQQVLFQVLDLFVVAVAVVAVDDDDV